MGRAAHRAAGPVSWGALLFLLFSAGCTDSGDVRLTVRFEPAALGEAAEVVELNLLRECPGDAAWGERPGGALQTVTTSKAGREPIAFDALPAGTYAVHARAVNDRCAVVAATCTSLKVGTGGSTREVRLTAWSQPSGCGALEQCDLDTLACSCAETAHACGGECVASDAPATCGDRCEPCPAPEHGAATCVEGECDVQCEFGYENCAEGCCPVVAVEPLVPSGDAFVYPAITVDTDGRPHVVYPGGTENTGLWHAVRDDGVWTRRQIDDTTGITDSLELFSGPNGEVHVVWSNISFAFMEQRLVKHARLDVAEPSVEALTSNTSVLAGAVQDGQPVIFVEIPGSYRLRSRQADGTWDSQTVTLPFAASNQDMFPVFLNDGSLALYVRRSSDCDGAANDSECAIERVGVVDGVASAAEPTGHRGRPWDRYGNHRRSYGVAIGDTLHALVTDVPAPGAVPVPLHWLRGASGTYELDESVVDEAAWPALHATPDGKTLWLTSSAAPETMDGGQSTDAGDKLRLPFGDLNISRRTLEGGAGEWVTTRIAEPTDDEVFGLLTFAFAADGAAHGIYLRVSEYISGEIPDVGIDYVFVPPGALDR